MTGTSIYSRPCLLLPPLNNVLDTDRVSLKTKLFLFFILSPPSPITPHPPFSLGLVHRHLMVSLFMDHWRKNFISGTKNVWLKGTPGKEAWVLWIQMKWIAHSSFAVSLWFKLFKIRIFEVVEIQLWMLPFCVWQSVSLMSWTRTVFVAECLLHTAASDMYVTFEKMW